MSSNTNVSMLFLKEDYKPNLKTFSKENQIDIENHVKILKNNRNLLSNELISNLKRVDTDVEELKKAISVNIQCTGLQYFKDIIKDISDSLDKNDNFLNCKQKDLCEKEKILKEELKNIEERVLDANMGRTASAKMPLYYKSLDTHHMNIPENIRLFDEFVVKHGGHTGGWKSEDHQLFLHLVRKYKLERVTEIICEKLPDISQDEVLAHNMWHTKYTELLQNKKDAIETWKKSKFSRHSKSVSNIYEKDKSLNCEKQKITLPQLDQNSIKKQIAEWKMERAIKLEEEKERKKQKEKEKRLMEEQKKEIEAIEKEKLRLYRETKLKIKLQERKEQEKLSKEDRENKIKKANIMIQVYRRQDKKKLKEKMEKKKEFEIRELENIERLRRVKCEVNVKRDPVRVQKATSVWKNKFTADENLEVPLTQSQPNFIRNVPHLKVPEWRQDCRYEDQIVL